MDIISSIYSFASTVMYLFIICLHLLLSPLCIISSSLYQWALEFAIDLDDQTALLILTLLIVWITSIYLIYGLIKNRTYKILFFEQFVFYLSCFNFILIGITYSYLKRENLVEQVLAKIFTTLLMIYIAEKIKRRSVCLSIVECKICFHNVENEEIILSCKHVFHQNCLWNWFYVKTQCPICFKAHNS